MTYALIEEGLKDRMAEADANGDAELWLGGWLDYAVARVPRLREERAGTVKKSLEMVDGGMQTLRVFYRLEPDAQLWIVARVK